MRETASVIALGSEEAAEEGNAVATAFQEVRNSFEKFCLMTGI